METKRLGIFLCFDAEGIIDDYVLYLLDDMIKNLTDLVIVSNGTLLPDSVNKLHKYTNKIMIRPNTGFDVGGWQDAMVNYCGFDMIRTYDELVLFNDSFFGPLYPFSDVFGRIGDKIDFWGLSVHGEAPNAHGMCPYGYRPRYLQTYFLTIRDRMLKSSEFEQFWKNLPIFREFNEVGEKFSCVFTKYFSDLGYKWCAYCDTIDLESTKEKAMSYHTFNTFDMVANRGFPVLKRKAFVTSKAASLRYNFGGELSRTIDYVKKNTSYDMNLVYKYLLRVYNLYDLKNSMNWNLILPEEKIMQEKLYAGKKIAVFAHMFYPKLFDYCFSYLKNVPDEVDVWVTTDSKEKEKQILSKFKPYFGDRFNVIVVNPRGRDLAALLVGCHEHLMKYDYIGFVHDKMSSQKEFATVGSSFCDLLWENMLKSEGFIHNLLNKFEMEPSLGLLVPPNVYHGTYFHSALNYWTICYDKIVEISDSLHIKANMDKEKPPISVGTVFWCRIKAFDSLFGFDWKYSDFPGEPLPNDGTLSHALERIFPFVAQSSGFFTETLMTSEYAQIEINNFRFMHNETLCNLAEIKGLTFSTHFNFIASIGKAKRELLQYTRTNETTVKEIVVDIGVKGALKNWFRKKFKKNKKEGSDDIAT